MSLADEILYGSAHSVEALINMGEPVEVLDEYGFTPLIESVIARKSDITALLLAHKADVNGIDSTGRTALHWAADNSDLKTCKLLLDHEANPNAFTSSGQPILVNPLLHEAQAICDLLVQHGANPTFANDFLNIKLLAHRYDLRGAVDIVNHKGEFIEIDFEGFFFESTVPAVGRSLEQYVKTLREHNAVFQEIIAALEQTSIWIRYQDYAFTLPQNLPDITPLLANDLWILPIACEGHAITFVKYGPLLAKCDRGENSQKEGTVIIYRIRRPHALTPDLVTQLVLKRNDNRFIQFEIKTLLQLQTLTHLPLKPQISGNCSWANVEASIPAALLLMMDIPLLEQSTKLDTQKKIAMQLYRTWREWDKDCALNAFMDEFQKANSARKASFAETLSAILFQTCRHLVPRDIARAENMLERLTETEYAFILRTYMEIYARGSTLPAGKNLSRMLRFLGINPD